MKKWLGLILCLTLLLVAAGCGNTAAAPSAVPTTTEAPTAEPVSGSETEQEAKEPEEFIQAAGGYASVEFVPMEDGAEICVMVVRPEMNGQFPTVITQNCYQAKTEEFNKEYIETCVSDSSAFVEGGYTFVLMQTRGTANSEYESFLPYIHDTDDELQVMDWIRGQDWYNGEIFCNGLSYMGFTSMSHLYAPHKDIKAVSVQCPVSTRYDAWYQNGFIKLGLMGFWQGRFHRPAGVDNAAAWDSVGGMDLYDGFPYIDWPVELYGYQEDYWTGILTHPEDDAWWREEAAGGYIYDALENLDVPVLWFDNFYDIFYEDSNTDWNNLPEAERAQSAFVVSQYGHTYKGYDSWAFEKGDSMTPTYNADYVVDFFDSVRNGTEPTKVTLGAVTYYPIDGDEWFVEEGTFTNGSQEHVLFLNQEGLEAEAGVKAPVTYVYDPTAPALFTASDENGGNGTNGYTGVGVDPEPGEQEGVNTFLGTRVEQETYIKGEMQAEITVSSDCEDTAFLVRIDVVKDGVTYNLREDITSLSWQLGEYTPGEEVTLTFETGPVACKLNEGDYLRVDIASSARGMYSLHTNVAGNQWEIAEPVTAHNTVYTGVSSITYYTEDLAA